MKNQDGPADIEVSQADMALIAAAPDMLAALKSMDLFVLVIESAMRNSDPSQHRAVLAALQNNQAVIAKAEGRS